jgi:hypothetical protein
MENVPLRSTTKRARLKCGDKEEDEEDEEEYKYRDGYSSEEDEEDKYEDGYSGKKDDGVSFHNYQ